MFLDKAVGVLLIPPLFLPESYGGAEQQTDRFGVELVRRGVNTGVLTVRQSPATPASELRAGLLVNRVLLKAPAYLGGRHTLSLVKWSLAVWLYLYRHRFDVGVLHIIHGKLHGVAAVMAARFFGMRTVVKLGRSGDHFDLRRLREKKLYGRFCAWIMVRWVDVFVANSQEIRADLVRFGITENRIAVIPNGVVVSEANVDSQREPNTFIYAGRLDPEKAVDLLFRSFARLERRDWRLDIFGDGQCSRELKSVARDLGLESNVVFHGAVTDVLVRLRRAQFYVSTSLSEGMSNSLLEAMSQGAVPLVTRVGGVSDIVVHGESGLLASPGNEDEYTRILSEAMDLSASDRCEMARRAKDTIRDSFSMEAVAERHIELYKTLLRGRARVGTVSQ